MKLKPIASNMTEIITDGKVDAVLFSYRTPVACHIDGQGYFRTSHKWSATTTKHINKWLRGFTAEEKPQEFFDSLLTTTSVF